MFNFGEAIQEVKNGKAVRRSGWNGKGMLIFLKKGSFDRTGGDQSYIDGIRTSLFDDGDTGTVTRLPCICMKTTTGSTLEGWLASQTDMLAIDWEIAE